jgi:hypothetical protein
MRILRPMGLLALILLAAGLPLHIAPVHGAQAQKKICHTVTKKVHGKKKKVRVCRTVKAPIKPTAMMTSSPTATATATATWTPVPTSTAQPVPVVDPASFAIAASEFGTGGIVRASQIESNSQADSESLILHFGSLSWEQQGRQSGYFMEVAIAHPDASGAHVTLVYYHASIFETAQQAAAAWQAQRNGWLLLDSSGGSCAGSGLLGDPGFSCVDSRLSASGDMLESYFKRGHVLIQAWNFASYDDVVNNLSTVLTPSLLVTRHIAEILDARAGATL